MLYDENISLTGRIVSPGEAQYDSARQAFNTFLIDSLLLLSLHKILKTL